jgi:hypothetical protein
VFFFNMHLKKKNWSEHINARKKNFPFHPFLQHSLLLLRYFFEKYFVEKKNEQKQRKMMWIIKKPVKEQNKVSHVYFSYCSSTFPTYKPHNEGEMQVRREEIERWAGCIHNTEIRLRHKKNKKQTSILMISELCIWFVIDFNMPKFGLKTRKCNIKKKKISFFKDQRFKYVKTNHFQQFTKSAWYPVLLNDKRSEPLKLICEKKSKRKNNQCFVCP